MAQLQPFELAQDATASLRVFFVNTASRPNGITGLTAVGGNSVAYTQAGVALALSTRVLTERGFGWYDLALLATDTSEVGALSIHLEGTGADDFDALYHVAPAEVARDDQWTDTRAAAITSILLDTGTDGVVLKAAGLDADAVAEIVAGWAAALPSAYETTAAKGSFAWIMGLLSMCHKIEIIDDTDDTATLKLYRSDGTTQWGASAGLVTSDPTATTPPVITGVEDTA